MRMRHSTRGILLASALLLVFGLVRLPMEQALDQAHRAESLRTAPLNLKMREKIGQLAFLAALSGFRALVADLLWIKAYSSFENAEWGRMSYLLDTVTTLQPRAELFWDLSHWHMAYNASASVYNDSDLPREAMRLKAQREYFDLGRDFLERGIQNNPDSTFLQERLGVLLQDKFKDPCGAADAFDKASKLPNARAYTRRFAAYEMAKCPGREKEAYERLRALYEEGPEQRKPTLERLLAELEEKLTIPIEQRIYKEGPPRVE